MIETHWRGTYWSIGVISLCAALVMSPVIVFGMVVADDTDLHLLWSHYFSEQLFSGDFYPRWLMGMNKGFGSPTFYFYPPLPFYVNSLLSLVIESRTHAHYVVGFSVLLSLIVGSIGVCKWLQHYAGRQAALAGAIAYLVLPYHLITDVYARGALAELWAMAFAPYLFYGATLFCRSKLQFFSVCTVSLWLLLLSHPPSSVVIVPLFCIYLAGFIYLNSAVLTWQDGLLCVAVMMFAALLSAFYTYPAVTLQSETMAAMWDDHPYHESFLYTGKYRGMLGLLVNLVSLFATVLGACVFALCARWGLRHCREIYLIIALFVLATLMTTPLTKPLWDVFAMLQKVQFPWRYNTVITLLLAFALGLLYEYARRGLLPHAGLVRYAVNALLAGCALASLLFGVYLVRTGLIYDRASYEKLFAESLDAVEYLQSYAALNQPNAHAIVSQHQNLRLRRWSADTIAVEGEIAAGEKIIFRSMHYGDWNARIDGAEPTQPVVFKNDDGLVEVVTATAAKTIELHRVEFWELKLGRNISLLAALVLGLALVFKRVVYSPNTKT